MPTVYYFEAKSIQNYILDSSKLKDMIGASEQIEYLCHDEALSNEENKEHLLDKVLNSLGLDDSKVNFARKAGGAFQALFSNANEAKNFQAVWTFCVQQAFPGLTFAQGMATDDRLKTALKMARDDLFKHDHNAFFPQLPLAGPLIARSPRTGQPAVDRSKDRSERLDTTTVKKRDFRDGTALINKLDFNKQNIHWPINLDEKDYEKGTDEKTFPLLQNNRYIAIVHADGNNLGQLLKTIQDNLLANDITVVRYAEVLRFYSQAIEKTTVKSAKQAIIDVVAKGAVWQFTIMPARPLVLAGDDCTFIVRGDLALDFTQVFLEQFEKHSQTQLNELKEKYPELDCLPEKLTACAGIAYIKASQPFYQGYNLAESLCKSAKNFAKSHVKKEELVPACLTFHRITTSIIDNYDTALEHELRREVGNNKGIQFTMQPYLVGEVNPSQQPNECIQIDAFKRVLRFFQTAPISHGTFREFLTLLESDQELADSAMQRWHDNMTKGGKTKLLNTLKEILEDCQLGNQPSDTLKLVGSEIKVGAIQYVRTPIGDALALMSISKGGDDVSDSI
ncbi:MAG TPA: hypothetical protein DCM38_01580 [Gammaproteobacteria bacterium]|nr:hypothetical protein [Gammaproteobacteria bacterium]